MKVDVTLYRQEMTLTFDEEKRKVDMMKIEITHSAAKRDRDLAAQAAQAAQQQSNSKRVNSLEQIADLHNRRSNLDVVAQRAKRHGYPLLVWPEDKLLLKLEDLPTENRNGQQNINRPIAWKRCEFRRIFFVSNDMELRDTIVEGNAYTRYLQQDLGTAVAEYKVESI